MNKQWIQPCPNCGNELYSNEPYIADSKFRILCIMCFLAGPACDTEWEAIKMYNKIEVHKS